jgi:glycosyltransferase involved in cell wall biosynthesis
MYCGGNDMNIAYFLPCFYPSRGGMQSYFLDLAQYMARDNSVRVYTSKARDADDLRIVRMRDSQPLLDREQYKKINIFRSAVTQVPFKVEAQFSESFTKSYRESQQIQNKLSREISFVFNWGLSLGMAKYALNDRSDIFHFSPLPFLHNHVGAVLARVRDKPSVFTPFFHHGSDHEGRFHAIPFHLFKKIVTVTEFEREKIVSLFKVPKEKVEVIPIPIDLEKYTMQIQETHDPELQALEGVPKIMFLGRLTYNKGLVFLVKALKKIWAKGKEIALIVVGKASPEWKDIQESLGSHRRLVRHYQDISDTQKIQLLRTADMLVVPSIVESFGIVFLEAWTQKRPVIGAKPMPYNEFIIDDETGFNVRFNDINNLVDKIERLADDPPLRKKLGENGYKQVKDRFSPEKVYPRIRALYEGLIRR